MNQHSSDEPSAPRALHPRCYTDPEVFARERERLFFRTWQFAGHVSRLRNAGDYLTLDVLGQGLFVVRGEDGDLHAFHNVCQHRAHELLSGAGNRARITCPYHGWTYTLDGSLRGAPGARHTPGFDASCIRLQPVRHEVFCGFVFVNLDHDAASMDERFPEAREQIEALAPGIDTLEFHTEHHAEEHCNWKVAVENYNECYHCARVHPTFSTGVVDPSSYRIVTGRHVLRHMAHAPAPGRGAYAVDAGARDYGSWFLWPAAAIQIYPGRVVNTYHWRPHEVQATRVHRGWYFPAGAVAEDRARLVELDRTTTFAEDLALVNAVQRGLNSRGYRPGPLIIDPAGGIESEHSIAALQGWWREALGECGSTGGGDR